MARKETNEKETNESVVPSIEAEPYHGDPNQPSPQLLVEIAAVLNGAEKTRGVERWLNQMNKLNE